MIADLAAALRDEARRANERRLLVLAGEREASYRAATDALDGAGVPASETTIVATKAANGADFRDCERVTPKRADALLGTTRTAVVLDCHDECRPNALGRTVGAVDGGGLVVLCTPPLDAWPDRRDGFDETLAVPPFDGEAVGGRFRTWLVETLRAHPGIAIVDVDSGTIERDGLTDPPVATERQPPAPPSDHSFPQATYDACLTADQADAVQVFERLREQGHALVVEADRGRGKSSAAGLAAGALAAEGNEVLVTAPSYRSAAAVFERARELLETLDALAGTDRDENPQCLDTPGGGRVRFAEPAAAVEDEALATADVAIVDEAAALPVDRLATFLDAPAVAFVTTVHGYEGAGRGFSVRFRDRLAESAFDVTEQRLDDPIRYAAGDPIEVWLFRALLLDARPSVASLVAEATPETVTHERLSADELLADEVELREAFGLLVAAHYRTEPNDLARLLDAPNVTVHALCHDGHVVSVALLAREGGLSADLRRSVYEGNRIEGHLLPDVLTSQCRDLEAGVTTGRRVLRIATHPAARSRGLGSRLLDEIRSASEDDEIDWLGVGYGATPQLVRFWARNGFSPVHLAITRNDRSGEHSALMFAPLSESGHALRDRHARWFVGRIGGLLTDSLADLDPDIVRTVMAASAVTTPLDLSAHEWRTIAAAAYGPGLAAIDPDAFRRLALVHLTDPESSHLSAREERLVVARILQGRPVERVANDLGYVSTRECLRALGDAYRPLVDRYGDRVAHEERDRYD
ncbi:tRNA(Met) cytidine acetyltransferase TmcA [Halococcus agarilyticus]|uniref:tRNA(Met) cytidine acetyltransferase TmcA n=1 Tax=Halococcus agarilyticus TaxID=1232219 RepID=UPI000677C7F4|nr:tRNA(Met) cytidine acetyltransferase TmcA [Halococcus agarilyticus]